MFSVAQLHEQSQRQLQPLYSKEEARALSYALLQHFGKLSRTQLYAFPETELSPETAQQVQTAIAGLLAHQPLQYVTGETLFCGFPIEVSGAVLIPRPETEELVEWAAGNAGKQAVVIDLCTGSGCIAIALKKIIPSAEVYACDLSPEALEVAQRNAAKNDAAIHFFRCDILSAMPFGKKADCIISNPPYVRHSEKAAMGKNVLLYEPPQALFVADNDPLVFYRAIARFAQQHLQDNGSVFVEINEALGDETKALFETAGFSAVELRKDMHGKDRMIRGMLNGNREASSNNKCNL
ncbi:MAG: peptide chain release factor N(5)-glutamine methyltransferase [Prevotellaceae bacterium]|jgi:release factor glutamine methyltransferase|nr:peptide chain release factor N(5)-glutamine methyltransferase [Prevotellaceae bacterium]